MKSSKPSFLREKLWVLRSFPMSHWARDGVHGEIVFQSLLPVVTWGTLLSQFLGFFSEDVVPNVAMNSGYF